MSWLCFDESGDTEVMVRKGMRLTPLERLVLKQYESELDQCRSKDDRPICQVAVYAKLVKAGHGRRGLGWWLDRKSEYELPYNRSSFWTARKKLQVGCIRGLGVDDWFGG